MQELIKNLYILIPVFLFLLKKMTATSCKHILVLNPLTVMTGYISKTEREKIIKLNTRSK